MMLLISKLCRCDIKTLQISVDTHTQKKLDVFADEEIQLQSIFYSSSLTEEL
jgi:hypothetical protein